MQSELQNCQQTRKQTRIIYTNKVYGIFGAVCKSAIRVV